MPSKSATSRVSKTSRKAVIGKGAAGKAAAAKSKTGKLPEWNLADLYSGIDAPGFVNGILGGVMKRLARNEKGPR